MTVPPAPQLVTEVKIMPEVPRVTEFTVLAWCDNNWRGILSEFVSTMLLILFGCMSCLPTEGIDTNIYGPFGFGFVVMLNIQIFGHISGAFMNPAVTLAAVIWGSTSIPLGIAYCIVQCAGATVGYGLLVALSPFDLNEGAVCVTAPFAGLSVLQVLGIEAFITGALILVNTGVWDPLNAHKQDSIPIKFGLTIVGLSLVGGPMTGASMNPARSLAPAIWTGLWAHQWLYWVGPFVGSIIAVVFYKYVFLKKRIIE